MEYCQTLKTPIKHMVSSPERQNPFKNLVKRMVSNPLEIIESTPLVKNFLKLFVENFYKVRAKSAI